ncbi:MAG: hypothetical protein LBD30_00710 [Verrucomicrobiales bacterium]|jgi:hypothetical protein|nr:hypothetical protein [Verrucomicrobiales bacterium]
MMSKIKFWMVNAALTVPAPLLAASGYTGDARSEFKDGMLLVFEIGGIIFFVLGVFGIGYAGLNYKKDEEQSKKAMIGCAIAAGCGLIGAAIFQAFRMDNAIIAFR